MNYTALLRGVNVGPAKRVPMAGLRALLEDLGCTDVRTLLNSGNAVFACRKSAPRALAGRIESALAATLGVSALVVVLTEAELKNVVAEIDKRTAVADPSRLLVAFPSRPELLALLAALAGRRWGRETLNLGSRAAYLWCPDGVARSSLSEAVNRALNDQVTSRNWDTVLKLQALVSIPTLPRTHAGGR